MKDENQTENSAEEIREGIRENGSVKTKNARGTICTLAVIGQIEGHTILSPQTKTTKYEHILPQLGCVEEDDETDGLLILLNTMGGDVEAGLAIAEMIAGMKKPCASLVLGGGHSIGVPLAVSAKRSFIVPSATMTVHPLRTSGVVLGVSQAFDYLRRMQDRIVDFVVRNSGISEEKFKSLMLSTKEMATDMGSVLLGRDAVKCGLIDEVGGIHEALEYLYSQIRKENFREKMS